MKGFSLLACAFLLSPAVLMAQNTFPSSGSAGVGTTSPTTALEMRNGTFLNTGDGTQSNTGGNTYHNTEWVGSRLYLYRSRGTLSSPLAVQHLDNLGYIDFTGNDGINSAPKRGGQLGFSVYGSPTNGVVPGSFYVSTTGADGNTVERLRITPVGNMGLGVYTAASKLHVLATTEQLRLGYDASNYASFTVNSSGTMTINSTGGVNVSTGFGFGGNYSSLWTSATNGVLSPNTSEYAISGSNNVVLRTGERSNINPTISPSYSYGTHIIGKTDVTIAGSGTHPIFAQQMIKPLGITSGAGVLTNSATLYLENASTGATNNYNLWSAGGLNRFDGDTYSLGNTGMGTAVDPLYKLKVSGNFHVASGSISTAGGLTAAGYIEGGNYKAINNSLIAGYGSGATGGGGGNIIVGNAVGTALTSGVANMIFGHSTANALTTGSKNIIIGGYNGSWGRGTGEALTSGFSNTLIGLGAGSLISTGSTNVAIGPGALFATNGTGNVAVGYSAGFNIAGSNNTVMGDGAGQATTTGNNVMIGYRAGFANTSGSNLTMLGYNAGNSSPVNLTNATAIGYEAQVTASNSLILGNGVNVGIGTTAPASKLTVEGGNIAVYNTGAVTAIGIGSTAAGKTNIKLSTSADANGYGILQSVTTEGTAFGATILNPYGGNVGIGTTGATTTAKLTVAGNILSQSVKVHPTAGADFVFADNYRLPSLKETEKFIKEHKHLPEVLPAAEMVKQGIDLGELNIKLLQKIEEGTLHAIEQNKQIEELMRLAKEQNKRIEKLEAQVKKN